MDDKIRQLFADRDAALLSLDEQRIREYFRQYNGRDLPADSMTFWLAVHKARTAIKALPMDARIASKRWLLEHGAESLDDGDVTI